MDTRGPSAFSFLTYPLQHKFSCQRVVKPLGKLSAVPHQQLLVRQDRFDGVEVDVHLSTHRGQVKSHDTSKYHTVIKWYLTVQ